jgi:hypothetical protein
VGSVDFELRSLVAIKELRLLTFLLVPIMKMLELVVVSSRFVEHQHRDAVTDGVAKFTPQAPDRLACPRELTTASWAGQQPYQIIHQTRRD